MHSVQQPLVEGVRPVRLVRLVRLGPPVPPPEVLIYSLWEAENRYICGCIHTL